MEVNVYMSDVYLHVTEEKIAYDKYQSFGVSIGSSRYIGGYWMIHIF